MVEEETLKTLEEETPETPTESETPAEDEGEGEGEGEDEEEGESVANVPPEARENVKVAKEAVEERKREKESGWVGGHKL